MQTRKFDELMSYFNRKVAEMSIDTKYKMELLGMVTALGLAHEKELTTQPEIIRCKDCKHFDPIYTHREGVCGHWNAKTENNAYCAYAERRTDGQI